MVEVGLQEQAKESRRRSRLPLIIPHAKMNKICTNLLTYAHVYILTYAHTQITFYNRIYCNRTDFILL